MTAADQTANSSTAFDNSNFDRLLEAASSGGMSDNSKPDSGGVLLDVGRHDSKHSNSTGESAGKAALAEALARHNITAQTKATAVQKLPGGV